MTLYITSWEEEKPSRATWVQQCQHNTSSGLGNLIRIIIIQRELEHDGETCGGVSSLRRFDTAMRLLIWWSWAITDEQLRWSFAKRKPHLLQSEFCGAIWFRQTSQPSSNWLTRPFGPRRTSGERPRSIPHIAHGWPWKSDRRRALPGSLMRDWLNFPASLFWLHVSLEVEHDWFASS